MTSLAIRILTQAPTPPMNTGALLSRLPRGAKGEGKQRPST